MKFLAKLAAVALIGVALTQVCFGGKGDMLAIHPELHWLERCVVWLRWPVAAANVWLAVRLWRGTAFTSLAARATRETAS
jgi:hypothetical protein